MLDLEQTLKELGSFVKSLTDDKEENIQQIQTRKKGICEPEHSLCAMRTHLIQHGRLCTGQYMWCGSSWSSQWWFMVIQQIITRKKGICEEIHKIRTSLNDHLDQLQETLIRSINKTVDDVTLQLGDVKNSRT
jgi:uncharacterized coiled-coil DUF342 family protein